MIRIQHYQYTIDKEKIKDIYEKAFPLLERFDFNILKKCNKESNVHLSCIYLNDIPVGMQFTIDLPNDITYLMYYAVDEQYRNKGIGSKVLQNIVVSKDKVMLCIERPVNEQTIRRKNFYMKNGFFETGIFFEDTNVQYEVLISCKNYKPTVRDLLNRYRFMTKNIWIWNKIKRTFDVEYIKFID